LDLFEAYKSELELVESEIKKNLLSDQPDLMEICKYISQLKGKRFRPLMVIMTYKFVGGSYIEEIVPLAAAIELIHTATLVHDDINDKSKFRRGQETILNKYGRAHALITGDYLFALGFKLGGSYGKDVVNIVADISSKLAEGEFVHLNNSRNTSMSEDTYIDIIERKTAGPISGGAKVGAIIGKAEAGEIEDIGSYGKNVGIAFQIIDDIFDIKGSLEELGKPTWVDLKMGKITLPVIQALKELEGSSQQRLKDIIKDVKASDTDFEEAVEIIRSTNALSYAQEKAESYKDLAIDSISKYESLEFFSNLTDLAKYTVERNY
jgi:geranylgeranyl pyrophosphate synthase